MATAHTASHAQFFRNALKTALLEIHPTVNRSLLIRSSAYQEVLQLLQHPKAVNFTDLRHHMATLGADPEKQHKVVLSLVKW